MKMLVPFVSLVHTLPLLALAASFGDSPLSRGLSIPIHKRGPLNAHGPTTPHWLQSNIRQSLTSVDSMAFISYTSLTQNLSKFQNGFDAYERNTGERHPLDRLPDLQSQEKRDMGSIPLSPADQQLWYGSISVGTPAKRFLGALRPFPSESPIDEPQWISTRGAAICSYLDHSAEKLALAMLCMTHLRARVHPTLGEASALSSAMVQLLLSRDTPTSCPLRGYP